MANPANGAANGLPALPPRHGGRGGAGSKFESSSTNKSSSDQQHADGTTVDVESGTAVETVK